MENNETQIKVDDYINQLKTDHINAIRLLEVDAARKFDEILFIVKTISETKSEQKESINVEN